MKITLISSLLLIGISILTFLFNDSTSNEYSIGFPFGYYSQHLSCSCEGEPATFSNFDLGVLILDFILYWFTTGFLYYLYRKKRKNN